MKLNLFFTTISSAVASIFIVDAESSTMMHRHLLRGGSNTDRGLMPSFPPYNQQCRDDAGPVFIDDAETFPNGGRYHDGKPAFAVGDCPDPLKGACSSGKSKTAAFLEGPLNCGNTGWYCRIVEQPGWAANNLVTDLNFAHCNTSMARDGDMTDTDGHCHGSDADDTYYWWVRDHWFRGYNGRLRCCCGWDQILSGGLVNNCDYRRLVTPTENLDNCRDANEENVQPFRAGCNAQNLPPLNVPLVEQNPEQCWEVQNFGEPCDDNCVTTTTGTTSPIINDNNNEDVGGGGDDEGDDETGVITNENENENEEEEGEGDVEVGDEGGNNNIEEVNEDNGEVEVVEEEEEDLNDNNEDYVY